MCLFVFVYLFACSHCLPAGARDRAVHRHPCEIVRSARQHTQLAQRGGIDGGHTAGLRPGEGQRQRYCQPGVALLFLKQKHLTSVL